jgi:putative flippase GtrA
MASIAIRYAAFALISTAVNLITQYMALVICDGKFSLYPAIFAGTLTGLVVKYFLDKRFIFYFKTDTNRDNLFKFVLYSLMGVVTTLIFWGFEISFNHFFRADGAKYIGAVIGLTIGYVIKYNLDKRFVFNRHG